MCILRVIGWLYHAPFYDCSGVSAITRRCIRDRGSRCTGGTLGWNPLGSVASRAQKPPARCDSYMSPADKDSCPRSSTNLRSSVAGIRNALPMWIARSDLRASRTNTMLRLIFRLCATSFTVSTSASGGGFWFCGISVVLPLQASRYRPRVCNRAGYKGSMPWIVIGQLSNLYQFYAQ